MLPTRRCGDAHSALSCRACVLTDRVIQLEGLLSDFVDNEDVVAVLSDEQWAKVERDLPFVKMPKTAKKPAATEPFCPQCDEPHAPCRTWGN